MVAIAEGYATAATIAEQPNICALAAFDSGKALEAAAAVKGTAIFPQLSAEQKERGMTDFNDLASQNPEIVASQFQEILTRTARQGWEGEVSGKMEKEMPCRMLPRGRPGIKGQKVYAQNMCPRWIRRNRSSWTETSKRRIGCNRMR